ncbi:MAG: GNAT family N-acetyltransferase [Firmicutes bacterium]|nr:GNAT family N-acetyltransferase [Bacillota bacterium]
MLQIEVVTNLEDFKALRDSWNKLALEANLSVFQTWEWSWNWWKANSKGKKLCLLVIRDGDKIAGIAPFYISSTYYGFPLKVVAFIGTNGTDYLDFIVNGNPDVSVALADFLLNSLKWDAIDLHQLPAGSPTIDVLSSRVLAAKLPYTQVCQDNCYNVTLPDNWDEYLAGLSKKFRWNVQYYTRRIARDYAVSYRLSSGKDVERDMELFFKLHQKRFINKKKPGAYLSPKFRKFHTDLATELEKQGWLRLYIMEIDGRAIAAIYGFAFGDSFYYYLGGFEPDWGNVSVSTVLIGRAIEDSIAEGLHNFNFLRGDEPYKLKWRAQESPNLRFTISRSGIKSGLVQKMFTLENDLTKRVKEKLG